MNNKGLCFFAKVLPKTIYLNYRIMGNVGLSDILVKNGNISQKIKNWLQTTFTNFIFSDYEYDKEDIMNVCETYFKQIKEENNLYNTGFNLDYVPETNQLNGNFYFQPQKNLEHININFRINKEI
jgi:hypothetical protein